MIVKILGALIFWPLLLAVALVVYGVIILSAAVVAAIEIGDALRRGIKPPPAHYLKGQL